MNEKKPKYIVDEKTAVGIEIYAPFYDCPACGTEEAIIKGYSYCPICGEKLYWKDERDKDKR